MFKQYDLKTKKRPKLVDNLIMPDGTTKKVKRSDAEQIGDIHTIRGKDYEYLGNRRWRRRSEDFTTTTG